MKDDNEVKDFCIFVVVIVLLLLAVVCIRGEIKESVENKAVQVEQKQETSK